MNANACNHLIYKLQMIGLMCKTLYHGNDHQVGCLGFRTALGLFRGYMAKDILLLLVVP